MNVEAVTAIIAALGGAAIIPKIIDLWKAIQSGRAAEEKRQNRTALGQLVTERQRAEDEAAFRWRIEEWAGTLVYMLTQLGVPADKIPDKPQRRERVR